MTNLTKPEWDELDRLLGKHGFGGYYDLVESLKIVLSRITNNSAVKDAATDLPTTVRSLMAASLNRSKMQ